MSSPAKCAWFFGVCVLCTLGGAIALRTWPQPFQIRTGTYPAIQLEDGRLAAPYPTQALLARVGTFDNELSAYLWFDYLRGRSMVDPNGTYLAVNEDAGAPSYRIYLILRNDALTAIPYLSQLESKGYIGGFELAFSNPATVEYLRNQTSLFQAAYEKPTHRTLETANATELLPSVSRFVLFKSQTDPRTRESAPSLAKDQASDLAADIITVAKFYDLPLDVFLGIGAMENNYLNVPGDLEHAVWKRRPARDDIVLRHLRHGVLVSDPSMGVWQITRETLRYAHELYRKDVRDYSQLPPRLRPPDKLEFDLSDSHVLTTYAGLLLRDLLDRFDGDVAKAVGAYNGGPRNPNPQYAAGVNLVAEYARNILERVPATRQRPANPATDGRLASAE
jgi:hypothetical protein